MAILEAVFADKAGQTPQEVERRRRMAQALLEAGSGGPAPSSGLELAGRLAMNLMGQYQAGQAEKQDASNRTSANKALIDAVYGGSPSASAPSFASQAAATSPSASSGGNPSYRDAIASIESKGSGDYNAVGPTNAKMGRALGRYQIMEANIGPWSKEALGREVSADEFMSNPQIQDAIFDHKFGSYVNKFGPEGAAQAWFAGPGGVGKTDRKDVLGTDVGTYGQKFLTALGPQSKPVEVASLGGASIDAPMAYYDDKGFRVENRPPVIQPDPNARPAGASAATVEANAPQNAAQAVNAMAAPRNVGALPVPPNSQPMPQGITAEFAGSQQLANAQGGIIPALMGGTAASPEQVAQARALGAAQPQPQTQGQDNRALIATLLGNPYTAEAGQQLLMQEMQRRQEANDPMRQMQLEEQRLKLDAARQPERQPLVNAGDGAIFDPNTQQWIQAPGGTRKPPQVVELFDEATGQPYKATWNSEKGEYERVGGVKARSGMQLTTNPDGTVTLTEGAIGGLPKLTEAEGRNSGFYGRGVESHKILNDLEGEGTSILNKVAGAIPVVGNYLQGEGAQKYGQAKRDFINAVLRRESGAVISPEEFANADQQYFPQPGDGPEVIAQKRKNRETTIQGLKISAGQGASFAVPSEQAPQKRKPVTIDGYTIEEVE